MAKASKAIYQPLCFKYVALNMRNGGTAKSWKSRVLKQYVDLSIL